MDLAFSPSLSQSDPLETHRIKIVQSTVFRQAPRLQRLFNYLVAATLEGRSERLKGYSIAVDVFDRPADFDPSCSALVRVEMGRLRSKLMEYYTGEGKGDSLRFELPKGSYAISAITTPTASVSEFKPEDALESKPSIAVLPFQNMSADAGQSWFADGITEDVITDLSKLSGLRVCSRHASFALQNIKQDSPAEIAEKLKVRYLLQGSIRRGETQVRINVHLTDTRTNSQTWAERYDRPLTDFLAVQADVTEAIVKELAIKLTPLEEVRLGHAGTSNFAAHEEVLRGLGYYWRFQPTYNREAQLYFQRAIDMDPEYADAYVWLSRSIVYAYTMRWDENRADLEDANACIDKALAIDGLLPQAHAAASWVQLWSKRYEQCVISGARAVELDPNSADARLFHSIALSITTFSGAGISEAEMCLKLNPMPSTFYFWVYGTAHMYGGNFDKAIEAMEKGIQVAPTFQPNHIFLIHSLVMANRMEEAQRSVQRYELIYGNRLVPLRMLGPDARDRASDWKKSLTLVGMKHQPEE